MLTLSGRLEKPVPTGGTDEPKHEQNQDDPIWWAVRDSFYASLRKRLRDDEPAFQPVHLGSVSANETDRPKKKTRPRFTAETGKESIWVKHVYEA